MLALIVFFLGLGLYLLVGAVVFNLLMRFSPRAKRVIDFLPPILVAWPILAIITLFIETEDFLGNKLRESKAVPDAFDSMDDEIYDISDTIHWAKDLALMIDLHLEMSGRVNGMRVELMGGSVVPIPDEPKG